MINNINKDEILLHLNQASKIIICSHGNADGDAIGSCLAMYEYLKCKNKDTFIILNEEVPDNYKFLPDSELIQVYDSEKHDSLVSSADLIVIIDLNDSSRLKTVEKVVVNSKAKKLVIDHHIDPQEFADYYYSFPEISASGELVFDIIKEDDYFIISQQIATNIYTAILTDTGSFRFPSTTSKVHRAIADLLELGARPSDIYDAVYNTVPAKWIELYGIALTNMRYYFDGRLAVMPIFAKNFVSTNTNNDALDGFVERMLNIKGVEVSVLASELEDKQEIKLSFRSKEKHNIRDLAMRFNGGGHKNAAGGRGFEYDIDKTIENIIATLQELKIF